MNGYKFWTVKEVKLLKELYPRIRVRDLIDRFPKRTKPTIVAKAMSLNLPSAKLWQPNENKIIINYFYSVPEKTLTQMLPGRSWLAIMAQGERLGIKRKRDKPRIRVNVDYFKKWSANMSYLLGFILADGCIIQGTYKGYSDSLKFGVQSKDRDILEKIKSELKSEHKLSQNKNAIHLCITSQEIVDDLKGLGIIYRKSLNEIVPKVPSKYAKDFIRGIVDGDGSLWFDKRNYPTLSVSGGENTLRFIRDHFFTKFKLYSKLSRRTYSEDIKKYLYQISYRCSSAKKLIEYLYADAKLYLNRKQTVSLKCLDVNIKIRQNSKYRLKQYNESFTR